MTFSGAREFDLKRRVAWIAACKRRNIISAIKYVLRKHQTAEPVSARLLGKVAGKINATCMVLRSTRAHLRALHTPKHVAFARHERKASVRLSDLAAAQLTWLMHQLAANPKRLFQLPTKAGKILTDVPLQG